MPYERVLYEDISGGPVHFDSMLLMLHHDIATFGRGTKKPLIGVPNRVGWRKGRLAGVYTPTVPAVLIKLEKPVQVWVGLGRRTIRIVWVLFDGPDSTPHSWEEGSEEDLIYD
ncbi:hypothetical protein HY091_01935 [Candidatus Kaiserbacteria bacterium]|nr:hypothetical protein [Candidatus Kaiserbacteria bacterium]